MINSCYEQINYMDLVKLFAVNTEQDFNKLQEYVNKMYEEGEIQWRIESKTNIYKSKQTKEVMNCDLIISDMINYVRLNDRIM
jgi:hypothetical protein